MTLPLCNSKNSKAVLVGNPAPYKESGIALHVLKRIWMARRHTMNYEFYDPELVQTRSSFLLFATACSFWDSRAHFISRYSVLLAFALRVSKSHPRNFAGALSFG